jgi:altered-inheritance-of-mitochondria protein 13
VQTEIERALEKENLDKERAMAGGASEGDGGGAGEVKSSAALQGDLEEIRGKVSKYQSRKELTEYPEVKSYGDGVVECYRYVKSSTAM